MQAEGGILQGIGMALTENMALLQSEDRFWKIL
ncbi:MAG: hypothetical protein V8S27_01115 [Lachnospiraceae bacterium]